MYRGQVVASNLGLVTILCVSCTSPKAPAPAQPLPRTATHALGLRDALAPIDVSGSETARLLRDRVRSTRSSPRRSGAPARTWTEPSGPATLTRPIVGATLVREGGEALDAALAALPPERQALGLVGLTSAQLYGVNDNPGLCESLVVDVPITEGGTAYEAHYRLDAALMTTTPLPVMYALSSTCTSALRASGGDVASAVGTACSREDEAAHFAVGSACRQCLAVDGDHARCRASAACPAETARTMMVSESGIGVVFYDVHEASMLACAPDHLGTQILLMHDRGPGDPLAAPFDHSAIARVCGYFWSTTAREPRISCSPLYSGVRAAMADVIVGRVDYLRRPGDTRTPLHERTVIADALELDGTSYEGFVLYPGTLAELSEADPMMGGYGFAPGLLRPDGTDPTNVDHTFARDWFGTVALKTATTINGVPIGVYNRNLCAADAWQGPDARGRYFCKAPFYNVDNVPKGDLLWQFDYGVFYTGINPDRLEQIPTVTLAATGLIDPTIPGGHIPRVLGSPVLADPDWENCAWPEQFEPDEMRTADTSVPGTYTMTTQTYRFGKDPNVDVRVVLSTSWRRGFCFEPID